MRTAVLATAVVLAAAGCTWQQRASVPGNQHEAKRPVCAPGSVRRLGSARVAYVAAAPAGAVAFARPGADPVGRFGRTNLNGYPTEFGVLGSVVGRNCAARWYRVQLPIRPNGSVGYVRASDVVVRRVQTRIVVDVSERRLTLLRRGTPIITATVAVGSPATPTPTGRYYVNQLLVPDDSAGPYGPGALGISAFSNVLTGWVQGGPVAIHGTNEPWSIGRAVTNGCIRLPNPTLLRVFAAASAGTPVIIRA
jgi:lipoprotein-anchoring transpeptidase ErfK/SrfK